MAIGDYASINFPPVVDRMGGMTQRILLAPLRDFLVLQKAAAGTYKIATAHTFQTGKGFVSVYVTQESGELSFESMGGRDRRSFNIKGMFEHPGESDEILKFANECKNDQWILLAELPGSTEFMQVGDAQFQVSIKPAYTTGKNSGDGRTSKFEFECIASSVIKYASTVTMKPTA